MIINGSVALITGAGSGLGLATAAHLCAAGASIVGLDIDESRLRQLAEIVPADRLLVRSTNVAEADQVDDAVEAAIERFGALHFSVNCAGVADAAKTVSSKGKTFPPATWAKVIGVNLTGTFNVICAVAAKMAHNQPNEDGERGVIINTASTAAWQGQVGQAAYSASKAGVIGLTLPVARDLAPLGIRVLSIAPGLFETGMVAGLPAEVTSAIVDRMILFPSRMGRPEEFARMVQAMIETPYMNATTISVDAGARIAGS